MAYRLNEDNKQMVIDKMLDNLKVLRTMLNLTQTELASLIGLGRQTYVSIETRKRPMTWCTCLSLMFVFSQNQETKKLLELFEIYTPEIKKIYSDTNS